MIAIFYTFQINLLQKYYLLYCNEPITVSAIIEVVLKFPIIRIILYTFNVFRLDIAIPPYKNHPYSRIYLIRCLYKIIMKFGREPNILPEIALDILP